MPIYEYECDTNKHRFEKWLSIQDDTIPTCPECGSAVHKVFHPAGIIFKGSGWYITDSRKPADAKSDGDTAKTEAKTETKSDAPTESKSESKGESKSETKTNKPSTETKASGTDES